MSEFYCETVAVGVVEKHPNAENLDITHVLGYPVVIRKGSFKQGDKAVYICVDALVPLDNPLFNFLDKPRIKAKKIRGIYSQGLLVPCPDDSWPIGKKVHEEMNIGKWEPPVELTTNGENEKDPGGIPQYTDIESLYRYEHLINPEETVIITEKAHGANGRFCMTDNGQFYVGSRTCFKREDERNIWWRVAKQYNLKEKLSNCRNLVVFGEVFGCVQDLRYGAKDGELFFRAFDAFSIVDGKYLDYLDFKLLMTDLDIPTVPVIYEGKWASYLKDLANGPSFISTVDQIREGFVLRPERERWEHSIGRFVLKCVGSEYHCRKEK